MGLYSPQVRVAGVLRQVPSWETWDSTASNSRAPNCLAEPSYITQRSRAHPPDGFHFSPSLRVALVGIILITPPSFIQLTPHVFHTVISPNKNSYIFYPILASASHRTRADSVFSLT